MKKNYIFKLILLVIPVFALMLMSNAGGKVNSVSSGSPGDGGSSCASCHNGGDFGATANITTNIPASGYNTNTAYTITVNANSSAPRHGFQLTAERQSDNGKVGSFSAGGTTRTINAGNTSITHNSPSNKSWTFTWNSPSQNEGDIKFFAAINAANGNGQAFDGQDQTVTTSTSNFKVLGISDAKRLDFDMYPNPASDNLTIQLPNISSKATVQFYDYVGRLALSKTISSSKEKINVSDLTSGVYILKVISDDKIGSQKFIKQ